jgi:hypothetical protein
MEHFAIRVMPDPERAVGSGRATICIADGVKVLANSRSMPVSRSAPVRQKTTITATLA